MCLENNIFLYFPSAISVTYEPIRILSAQPMCTANPKSTVPIFCTGYKPPEIQFLRANLSLLLGIKS